MIIRYYNTDVHKTPSGADIRIDDVPCGMLRADGSKCNKNKKKIFIRYKDSSGKINMNWAFSCEHQLDEAKASNPPRVWWGADMIESMYDKINLGGKSLKSIQDYLRTQFPNYPDGSPIPWSERAIPETRPGKGKVKGWDCSTNDKYEKIKQNKVIADVWDKSVLRKDADAAIQYTDKSFSVFKPKQTQVIDYSDCLDCGHEMIAHDNYSKKCCVCKKYCSIGGLNDKSNN